jgi:hypothetical protein
MRLQELLCWRGIRHASIVRKIAETFLATCVWLLTTCAELASSAAEAAMPLDLPPGKSAYDIIEFQVTNAGPAHSIWLMMESNRHRLSTNLPAGMTEYDLIVEPALKKLLPAEYSAFQTGLRVTPLVSSAGAALLLTQKAADLLTNTASAGPSRRERLEACRAAWRLCLRITLVTSNAQSAAATQLILAAWNHSLNQAGVYAATQVAALGDVYNPIFATENLWRLVDAAHDLPTISSFASLVYQHGATPDWDRLRRKQSDHLAPECSSLLYRALQWKRYDEREWIGVGPATGPPSPQLE